MPSTQRAAIPYPSATDAPTAAADMQALAEALDSNVVLHAVDAADRDAKYLTPVPGMVVTADDGTVWVADAGGGWHTVYEPPPPWVAVTTASGVAGSSAQALKTRDGHVYLRGLLNSTGEVLASGTTLAWVPSGSEPVAGGPRFFGVAAALAGPDAPSAVRITLGTDGAISFNDNHDRAWVALDGIQYWFD